MRPRRLLFASVALVAVIACGTSGKGAEARDQGASVVPSSVSCADAARLTQHATDDRREIGKSSSDHERIYLGNRANFFASLAIVADLTCKTTQAPAEETIALALAAAREAAASSSMYERAQKWNEAGSRATHAIALLIQQLPAPPSK